MGLVGDGHLHLPAAPASAGGEDRGAPPAEILGDQQGKASALLRFRVHQDDGARLGLAGVLEIQQVRQALPLLDVLFRILFDAGNQAIAPRRRKLDRGGRDHIRSLAVWKNHGKQIVQRRLLVSAIG